MKQKTRPTLLAKNATLWIRIPRPEYDSLCASASACGIGIAEYIRLRLRGAKISLDNR